MSGLRKQQRAHRAEVQRVRMIPHPAEFELYYSL